MGGGRRIVGQRDSDAVSSVLRPFLHAAAEARRMPLPLSPSADGTESRLQRRGRKIMKRNGGCRSWPSAVLMSSLFIHLASTYGNVFRAAYGDLMSIRGDAVNLEPSERNEITATGRFVAQVSEPVAGSAFGLAVRRFFEAVLVCRARCSPSEVSAVVREYQRFPVLEWRQDLPVENAKISTC